MYGLQEGDYGSTSPFDITGFDTYNDANGAAEVDSSNCPAPSVSYNGSLLTGGLAPAAPHHWNNGVPVFNDVREVKQ